MNRRNFLKSAAGLLVASTALAVPDHKVWALDQTMIPDDRPLSKWVPHLDEFDAPITGPSRYVDCGPGNVYINGQCVDPRTVTMNSAAIQKYDMVKVLSSDEFAVVMGIDGGYATICYARGLGLWGEKHKISDLAPTGVAMPDVIPGPMWGSR